MFLSQHTFLKKNLNPYKIIVPIINIIRLTLRDIRISFNFCSLTIYVAHRTTLNRLKCFDIKIQLKFLANETMKQWNDEVQIDLLCWDIVKLKTNTSPHVCVSQSLLFKINLNFFLDFASHPFPKQFVIVLFLFCLCHPNIYEVTIYFLSWLWWRWLGIQMLRFGLADERRTNFENLH